MILHHYAPSPYSEKIRLMLGYAEMEWFGVTSPAMPPRPNVDPLVGGYRRMPVAQLGADLFCDTRLISAEIAADANLPALDPATCREEALGLSADLEGEVFMACVASIPAGRTLRALLRLFGPIGAFRFIRDRSRMSREAATTFMSPKRAVVVFDRHLEELNQYLDGNGPFLGGEAPSHLDFAAYHTFWFHREVGNLPVPEGIPALVAWYQLMGQFGHGVHSEIRGEEAFAAAKGAEPRGISDALKQVEKIGETVTIRPADYGLDGTTGELVGADARRWIIARDTDFGRVHVHFPTDGFVLE